MPIVTLILLGISYGLLAEAIPHSYGNAKLAYEALSVGVSGVTVWNFAAPIISMLVGAALGLAVGALGLWLPYHAIFGRHDDRWPK
jgi:tetrahydromethanopterin S-methyltransferase subunit C